MISRSDAPSLLFARSLLAIRASTSGAEISSDGASFVRLPLQQGVRDIVAIPHTFLARMRRRHGIVAVVEDTAGKKRRRGRPDRRSPHRLLLQLGLHGVKESPVQDWLMLAGMDLAAIRDLANVEPVLQEMCERAVTVAGGCDDPPICQSPRFWCDTLLIK